MVRIQCIIKDIGRDGIIEWKFNGSSIIPCTHCSIQVTTSNYDEENCSFVSTILITKFTVVNQGIYVCNASQYNPKYYNSDSIYLYTNTDIVTVISIGTTCVINHLAITVI